MSPALANDTPIIVIASINNILGAVIGFISSLNITSSTYVQK